MGENRLVLWKEASGVSQSVAPSSISGRMTDFVIRSILSRGLLEFVEVRMTTTDVRTNVSTGDAARPATVEMKFEMAIIPVSDADRAKKFYMSLGWRSDADFPISADFRVLQFTPPGSQASILFGTGVRSPAAGLGYKLLLVVRDVDAARADLVARGVVVSEVFHGTGFRPGTAGRLPGPDPERRSYSSFASFSDPDGNEWLMQEIKQRLPGRGGLLPTDVPGLADLLHETAEHHDPFEKSHPPHNWWDWYAAYLHAREQGNTSEEASAAAGRYMEGLLNEVPS
jgi:predicted enzyme related to lactoylglutathione lyase